MCSIGFIKRFAPFFLTFAVGMLIASFFVSIASPRLNFRRGGFNKHHEFHRQQENELRNLREENSRLREELRQSEIKNQSSYTHDWETGNYPLIRESDNFQPRIEREDILVQPRKMK